VNIQAIAAAHQFLRDETSAAHARVDAIVGGGLHSHSAYAAYVRGMERFIAASQQALPDPQPRLRACREWLASDLSAMRIVALPEPRARPSAFDAVAQLGWEYVVAGAAIGARFLLRQAQALGYTAEHGARFLAGHAGGDHWPRFLTRLEHTAIGAADLPRLREAALMAFAAAEEALQAAQQRGRQPISPSDHRETFA
jgi:heme oxygenase